MILWAFNYIIVIIIRQWSYGLWWWDSLLHYNYVAHAMLNFCRNSVNQSTDIHQLCRSSILWKISASKTRNFNNEEVVEVLWCWSSMKSMLNVGNGWLYWYRFSRMRFVFRYHTKFYEFLLCVAREMTTFSISEFHLILRRLYIIAI